MATIPVKDANNTTVDLEKPLAPGRALAAVSRPVVLSSEDLAALAAIVDAIEASSGGGGGGSVTIADSAFSEYETVAASATQVLGATGATGDYLSGVLIVPASLSPGAVSIKDGSGSTITIFTGGSSSVSNLVPFFVPLGIKSTGGAWSVITGTSVSAIGVGNFT